MTVFDETQTQFFSEGETTNMAPFGASQIVAQGSDSDTGQIVWAASVSEPTTYYVQVLNDSDFSIDYTLSSTEISSDVPTEPETEDAAATATPETIADSPMLPMVGTDPGNPDTLTAGETARGTVAPHSTYWYTFIRPNVGSDKIEPLDYSLFFTPDDGNRRHHVNFELFEYAEFGKWQRGDQDEMNNFGAGMLISRDGDDNTGERTWTGSVTKGDQYLMSISNGSDGPMDFWLFDDDVINPILGPIPAPAPAPAFVQGSAPHTAIPLDFGENKGGLDPGEEAWYAFRITDFDNEFFEEMALTMITTPDDGNRIRNMTFDVFTAGDVNGWSPGDNSKINNVGAGSVVYRDDNDQTGERFWKGWVIDNDLYYVQIRNGTGEHMDYHLFTGDVYGAELGDEPQPVVEVTAAAGKSPGTAVPLIVDINKGQLQPGEEQWHTFSRGDAGATGSVETIFTMIFTPDDGNRIRQVNFQLFEGNQLRDWSPDNRFGIVGFGQGSVVNRDGGIETGELLWKGHVIANDTYFMRISNESDTAIDYTIYPDDVIEANLE